MNTGKALLYARTISRLKPRQVVGRLWKHLYSPRPDLSPPPARRAPRGAWLPPAARPQSMLSRTRVRFLGREREVTGAADWNAPDLSRLWLYNLHYFEDLCARGGEERRAWHERWIERWRRENEPGDGPGWEPYPLSLRVVNWIRWSLGGGALSPGAVHSLAVQARYLRAGLEYHLLGNHLLANAKALVFAGLYFEGEEAARWLDKGLGLLSRELDEQVLPDGGHFERSPMYHSLALDDVLDLLNLARAFPDALPPHCRAEVLRWREAAQRMRRWLALMTHPDGEIALFNDAAFGVAPAPEELEAYARRLGLGPRVLPSDGLHHLASSGYVRLQNQDAVAILDVGEIGPTYLPGHAHADSLSFELSLGGRRFLVNSGTSLYDDCEERLRQRSTAAHNTVVVDGADSSEVWRSFRVARRALPRNLDIETVGSVARVRCEHDGYLRLPGRVVHRREWRFTPAALEVTDELEGTYGGATARLHLHPDVQVPSFGNGLQHADGPRARWSVDGGDARLEDTTWHPRFGTSLPSRCLRCDLSGPALKTRLRW